MRESDRNLLKNQLITKVVDINLQEQLNMENIWKKWLDYNDSNPKKEDLPKKLKDRTLF